MSAIWFSSDFHYGHNNLVAGISQWEDKEACRAFDTQESHDEFLIHNINKVVGKDDILYFTGDWSMGGIDNVWKFRNRLYVKNIHFIGGNHDHHIRKNAILKTDRGYVNTQSLFTSYQEILEKKIGGHRMVLCHYPILHFHKESRGAIHLYGHTHRELNFKKNTKCISIDCHSQFRPFHIEEILTDFN